MADTRRSRGSIVIAGSLAQRPGHGGHAWVFLQYLLGFRRLGYDVLFLDQLQPRMCVDENAAPAPFEQSWNARYFGEIMRQFGLGDSFSLSLGDGERTVGVPRPQVIQRLRDCVLLLNVMGFLADPEYLRAARRRVFLDIDPGFGQMWRELGLADIFKGHDDFVTIGLNVGAEGCAVPTRGLRWITTPPPVVLEHWPVSPGPADGPFMSIASWRGPFGPIEYGGKTYGLRVHEFRRFLSLPAMTGAPFTLAMDIDPADRVDSERLDDNRWRRIDPREAAGTPQAYQRTIARSRAEFMVAKNLYVATRGGWFSDRSTCFLASGRPVLAQETGIAGHFPVGRGLVTFSTLEEAAAGVESISRDYQNHARAARALAEQYFDSDKVLGRLLQELAVT